MPARALRRAAGVAALACAAALSACGPPLPERVDAPIAIRGLEAYRAGDPAGLKAAIAELDAKVADDPAAMLDCSRQGYAWRRAARLRNELVFLDKSTVFAAGEQGRFLFWYARQYQGAGRYEYWRGRGIEPVVGGGAACREHPDYRLARAIDDDEMQAFRGEAVEQLTAWENELRVRWGPTEFDRRMAATVKTLHSAHLSQTDRWSPSH